MPTVVNPSVSPPVAARPTVVRPHSLAHYCTSAINRLSDAYWETRLGVATTGIAPSEHLDANRYGYLSYHTYFSIFARLGLAADDVVVDLGCGKGRVVCAAATMPIRESIGVEIDPELCAAAEANLTRLRGQRTAARIVRQSAVEFDYDRATALVMFHPFGAATMEQVLDRLATSFRQHPRPLRIAYANPVFDELLTARPWLERFATWNPGRWSRLKFPVHFYWARG